MKAANTGKKVLVIGDINIDRTNPYHKKSKEAKDLLALTSVWGAPSAPPPVGISLPFLRGLR